MKSRFALVLFLGLSACGEDAEDRLARAQREIAGLELGAAKVDLVSVLADKGENPEILRQLAAVQLQLGDGDGAATTAMRLERAGGAHEEVVLIRAESVLLRGNADEALALLGSDRKLRAERIRAAALLAKGDAGGAVSALRRGAAAGADPLLHRDLARLLIDAQDLDGAQQQVAILSRLDPQSFDALMLSADIAARRGQYGKAHELLARAENRYPRIPDPLLARATVFDLEGKIDEAVAMTERAGKISPDDGRVKDLKVQFASMKGDWDKVRTMLARQERDLDPQSANGLSYAEAMLRTGHPEQARAMFQRALTRSPTNPYARVMLAEAQLAVGDARGAFATLQPLVASTMAGPRELELAAKAAESANLPEAAAIRTRSAAAHNGMVQKLSSQGQAAMVRQDWNAAVEAYAALSRMGDDAEVLKRLSLALSHSGKTSDAIRAADRARMIRPDDPDTLYVAGLVRARAGSDLPAAIELLRKASQAEPKNAAFRSALARYQAASGA